MIELFLKLGVNVKFDLGLASSPFLKLGEEA